MEALRIGGLTPLTTVDFPGKLAAVVFCQGCPWRCGYCHNPHLLPAKGLNPVTGSTTLSWAQVREFLERRRGLLDGVVFSGGEPTSQAAIVSAVREIKAMGLRAGLHTGGAYPARLAELLPHLDWVGFDVKARADDYETITDVPGSSAKTMESLTLLLSSGVDYEVRTTVYPGLDEDGLCSLARTLAAQGVRRYAVQECRLPVRGLSACDAQAGTQTGPAGGVSPILHAPLSERARVVLGGLFRTFEVRAA